jgi:RNA polymerase sigma-70 factor (ECF subfamily)
LYSQAVIFGTTLRGGSVVAEDVEAKLALTTRPGGSDDQLSTWVAGTVRRALGYAVTLIRNQAEAEDIVHDCYIRLLARSDHYDLPKDGTKLLFRSITNACINWKQRRPPVVSLDDAERGGGADRLPPTVKADADPEHRAICGELGAAVAAALAELPVTQRAIVELRGLGHSLVDAADMLEISHANARVLLHRARRTLAARLRPFIEDQVT